MNEPVMVTLAKKSAQVEQLIAKYWTMMQELDLHIEIMKKFGFDNEEDMCGLIRIKLTDFENRTPGLRIDEMLDPEAHSASIAHDIGMILREWSLIDHQMESGGWPRYGR